MGFINSFAVKVVELEMVPLKLAQAQSTSLATESPTTEPQIMKQKTGWPPKDKEVAFGSFKAKLIAKYPGVTVNNELQVVF